MLSIEVAQFYGVKDGPHCADFVAYINGMLGFAEANRRECWDQLCLGMINVQTKVKTFETLRLELVEKHNAVVDKYNAEAANLKKLTAHLNKVEEQNKRLEENNKRLEGLLATRSSPPPSAAEAPKVQLELAKPNAPPSGAKPDAPRAAKRTLPEATVPDSDDEQGPPAKRDKSETIVQLRKKIIDLTTENERLDRLLAALKKVDAVPAETGKTRLTQEEMGRLRKANAELEATLSRLTEEAHRQVHRDTEAHKEHAAAWAQERLELIRRIEDLSKPNTGGTARIEDLGGGVGMAPLMRTSGGTARIEDVSGGIVMAPSSIVIPSAFQHSDGTYMACPVPIRTGRLMSLLDIYKLWIRYPSDNEGTFFATIVCPFTKQITSLASVEEVTLLHSIAMDLRLFTMPPLRFQYYINGNWIDFSFIDQIVIAALCCKHYRVNMRGVVIESVMVCNTNYVFTIHIVDNVVDFQVQSLQNRAVAAPACLYETVVVDFFQRWSYPTGSDGREINVPQ